MLSACLLAALTQAAATPPPQQAGLLLVGARVLSPAGTEWLEGRAVLVRGERIAAIEPLEAVDDPALERVDLSGQHLVPGLIDLHTHLVLHPYDEAPWNDQVLKESLELRTIRGVVAARATLRAGFTTIRELGTEGAGYADVALRDAIEDGLIEGPRVLAATRAIVATGCYGPAGFDPRWDLPVGAQEADGADGVRVAVRQQIAAGADWIKLYGDYRRRPGAPATPTFTLEELSAAVDEARSAGLRVAVHATTDEAIRRAVEAGAATIEHGTEASAETLALMQARGVALVPTLAAAEAVARYAGPQPGAEEHPRIAAARALMTRALEAGVTVACGSDAGVFAHGRNARELELMCAWGMPPAEALRAATATAADVLGRGDLGRLAVGAQADLAAFERDPLEDVSALRRPSCVMRSGRVVPAEH